MVYSYDRRTTAHVPQTSLSPEAQKLFDEDVDERKFEVRQVMKKIQHLTKGRYQEPLHDTPTMLGYQWPFIVDFDGSWVSFRLTVGHPFPKGNTHTKSGMYHLQMDMGLEDANGSRGNEPVPGAPRGWVSPQDVDSAVSKALVAFGKAYSEWSKSKSSV